MLTADYVVGVTRTDHDLKFFTWPRDTSLFCESVRDGVGTGTWDFRCQEGVRTMAANFYRSLNGKET